MGPLLPYVISEEFSLIIALFLGIGFGFALEQAGFSSTKKLVGLFYGYDFTVLRVFFTAGITAMAGVLLLGHYGMLDLKVLYINPTFLNSALIGGAIMGAGFIIGGFCPGTSMCALAIGKLDAFTFLIGAALGIFAFTESFPVLENLYRANNLGNIRISEYLGISNIAFAFFLATLAIATFLATWYIENKVNKRKQYISSAKRNKYAWSVAALFTILGIIAFLPGEQEIINMRIAEAKRQQKCVFKEMSADKLAGEIVNKYYQLNIIDVRTPEEYEKYHLPLAINIPFDKMMERQYEPTFKQRLKTNIFYASNDTLVKMACLKARHIGNSENYILKESAEEFQEMFFVPHTLSENVSKSQLEIYTFRKITAGKMNDLVDALKNIGKPVKREAVKIKGGC